VNPRSASRVGLTEAARRRASDQRFAQVVLAAADWEKAHGPASTSSSDDRERAVAELRQTLRAARAGSGRIRWDAAREAFVTKHWPRVWVNSPPGRPVHTDEGDAHFQQRVREAAAWEAEHGSASLEADTPIERSIAQLRANVRSCLAKGAGRIGWNAEREQYVMKHWPGVLVEGSRSGNRDDDTFEARVLAAAAWEAAHGRPVSRTVPGCEQHATLRQHMRAAWRGKGRLAWDPEREAFADEHWPAWRP